MPGMDGVETTTAIRAFNQYIPIIALTANVITGMKEMFLEKGFNDFLAKPIDVSQLDSILANWIKKRKLVLLVDGNPANLRLGISVLEDKYDVITAPSVAKMLKLLENSKPDVILMNEGLRGSASINKEAAVVFITEPFDQSTLIGYIEDKLKGGGE